MAKTWNPEAPYRKGTTVRLIEDLPGVPEGTIGKVRQANGFRWKRYWVRFDGEMVGQISHSQLVPTKHWDTYLANVAAAEAAAAAQSAQAVSTAGTAPSAGAAAAGGASVNGVAIPANLLARSAAARERLGG